MCNSYHNYRFEIDAVGFRSGVILFLPVHKARKCPCAVCKARPHWFLYLLIVSCAIAKSPVSLQRGQDAFVFPQLNATIARCWPTNPPMWFTWKPFKGALFVSTHFTSIVEVVKRAKVSKILLLLIDNPGHKSCGAAKSWGEEDMKKKQVSLKFKRKHILLGWDSEHNTLSK